MGGKVIDCYCTDSQGARIELGEVICLSVGGRIFTAQCQMSLNVPMWRELNEGCASSSLEGRDPSVKARLVHAHVAFSEAQAREKAQVAAARVDRGVIGKPPKL
nr:hypothetical protein [Mesobacterium pallidum]